MSDSISVIACGDFVATKPSVIKFSDELRSLLQHSDIRICNFEAPIEGFGKAAPKSGPSLAQSKESPAFLEDVGFNVALMANNHIMDYGVEACMATLDSFKNSMAIGVGKAKDAYSFKTVSIKNKSIGLLAFCQYEFGIVESATRNDEFGVAWINSSDVCDTIRLAKSACDYVLVFPHAGLEDIDAPLPCWRRCYQNLIEWGADAVIASHPHVPQGWEIHNNKPIFYSLGNFYFDVLSGNQYWNKGLLVKLEFADTIKFKVYNTKFLEDGSIVIDHSEQISTHTEDIISLLSDEPRYFEYIDKECLMRYSIYTYSILRGIGGISWFNLGIKHFCKLFLLSLINKRDRYTLLNILRCETHRWVYERCITLTNNSNGIK